MGIEGMKGGAARTALIFGASGAIGHEIAKLFRSEYECVYAATRRIGNDLPDDVIPLEWSLDEGFKIKDFFELKRFDAIVWAQGSNYNDSIYDFDRKRHAELYNANVVFIMESLKQLIDLGLISDGSRLCIISSIWQEIVRQNKLSYSVTKSALKGLVRSLSVDLGNKNILVNAVLPGALDTPMTRANLGKDQIEKLEKETPLQSLPKFEDVSGLVSFLCSINNTGITGQFIAADRGYSFVRFI